MDWTEIVEFLDRLVNTRLFTLSNQPVTLTTLVVFSVIVMISLWFARVLGRGIQRALSLRGVADPGIVHNINQLVRYCIVVVGIAIALQNVGIDLGALFAAGAFFAVAVGFALQGFLQSFVAGVLLLAERSIKNGDVLEVEKQIVRVTRMGLRVTVARTRDEEDLIIPNTTLAQSIVRNYTLRDPEHRIKSTVRVPYGTDLRRTMVVLREAAHNVPFRTTEREPRILLTELGESAAVFEVHVWTRDPWVQRRNTSELNLAVWSALKTADITIAYPQLDVHLDRRDVEPMARAAS